MTNLTIAAISFLLETNWITTHTITPVPGFHDSTTYSLQTSRVERVEYRIDTVRGREIKREVDREFVVSTNLPPRIWPTNAPPNMLGGAPFRLLTNRQDIARPPEPPLPPKPR